MQKISLYKEITQQIGIFLALVIGFVVAQGWNRAVWESVSQHQNKDNEDWFWWVYTLIATVIGLSILIAWGYVVSNHVLPMRSVNDVQASAMLC
jgi:putative flippase GtrA